MAKLLLIDGSNLLFQMFYGMPNPILGKNGKNIAGIWGFTGALLKICKEIEPTHILVLFDGEQQLNRQKKEKSYKANRPNYQNVPEEENPFSILFDIKRVLSELNIFYYETADGLETDDYMKEYCLRYQKNNEIVISSHDKDFIALVNENVSLYSYRGKKSILYTPKEVREQYFISPEFFSDYKALVGDKSDNINGIPKIGKKTAVQLIQDFGYIENIIKNQDKIQKPSIKEAIVENKEMLLHNIFLIRLVGTNKIPKELEELVYIPQNRKTKEILETLDIIKEKVVS